MVKSGLEVLDVARFPKTYNYEKIKLQIDACRSTLKFIDDDDLRDAMSNRIDKIDVECQEVCQNCPDGEFILGHDWVITAIKR